MTPPPEFTSFLEACLANPDDALPRLVFADYLDEFGMNVGQLREAGYWFVTDAGQVLYNPPHFVHDPYKANGSTGALRFGDWANRPKCTRFGFGGTKKRKCGRPVNSFFEGRWTCHSCRLRILANRNLKRAERTRFRRASAPAAGGSAP